MEEFELIGMLAGAFSPECVQSEAETRNELESVESYKDPELILLLERLIRNEEISWKQKAAQYLFILDPDLSEEDCLNRFKYVWQMLTEVAGRNDPWPLDPK